MGRRMTKDYVVAINKLTESLVGSKAPWNHPLIIEEFGLRCEGTCDGECRWCKSSVAFLEFIKTGAIKKEKDV
jgi:hypothetical protein